MRKWGLVIVTAVYMNKLQTKSFCIPLNTEHQKDIVVCQFWLVTPDADSITLLPSSDEKTKTGWTQTTMAIAWLFVVLFLLTEIKFADAEQILNRFLTKKFYFFI